VLDLFQSKTRPLVPYNYAHSSLGVPWFGATLRTGWSHSCGHWGEWWSRWLGWFRPLDALARTPLVRDVPRWSRASG